MIRFTVPGRPVPAARMTHKGKFVSRQAERYLSYKNKVGWIAKQNRVKRLDGPVSVEVYVYLYRGRQGDADNYGKAVMDSLNEIAYHDDVQVKRLLVEKRDCGPDEERAEVIIVPLSEVTIRRMQKLNGIFRSGSGGNKE